MRKIKTIIILAAGDGTRFWPLTDKIFINFLGKPLLGHILEQVYPKAEKIIITTSSESKAKVEQVVAHIEHPDCEIIVTIQERLEEGMAGAVTAAKNLLQGELLVLNANDVLDFSLIDAIVEKQDTEQKDMLLLAKRVTEYFPGGYLAFKDGKITEIIEKPGPENTPSDITKLVVDYFADAKLIIDAIESTSTTQDDWYEKALSNVIIQGKSVDYVLYNGIWKTIKYPWQVLDMMEYFLSTIKDSSRGNDVKISPTAIVTGPVIMEDGVSVGDYAKIAGPCYLGKDVIVGDYAFVRGSHVGEKCLVGGGTEVARSYLSPEVMLHRDYVGDSVLGKHVLMGADAVTANYRFDAEAVSSVVGNNRVTTGRQKLGAIIGNNAKVGVHCTITPGVKIGQSTYIGPHTLVTEDVEEKMFLFKGEKKQNKLT